MAMRALSRHWSVWKAAWQAEKGSGTICRKDSQGAPRQWFLTPSATRATEFLPAVLEI
jgi:hypothetical protein